MCRDTKRNCEGQDSNLMPLPPPPVPPAHSLNLSLINVLISQLITDTLKANGGGWGWEGEFVSLSRVCSADWRVLFRTRCFPFIPIVAKSDSDSENLVASSSMIRTLEVPPRSAIGAPSKHRVGQKHASPSLEPTLICPSERAPESGD